MNILDLAEELMLAPKKSAHTNGGEYKSRCPKCQEGKDRFCIWPNQGKSGRYWCRVCGSKGDGIQFCRDFLGISYQEACHKLDLDAKPKLSHNRVTPFKKTYFIPEESIPVSKAWQQTAESFIRSAHESLWTTPRALETLEKRGFNHEIIRKFSIGWNPFNLYELREKWGLQPIIKENGKIQSLWIPQGVVIPSYRGNLPIKIKIRRNEWHEEDHFPKYVELSGSMQSPAIYGDMSKPIIIVESELDAILIQQRAAHLICCLALGGVSKKPDVEIHKWLKQAPLILLSLDFDEAGKKKYAFWMKLYPNLKPWPAPVAKSAGDAFQKSPTDLLSWIKFGLYAS